MSVFRFDEDRLPYLSFLDKWDNAPLQREDFVSRALHFHRVVPAGALTPGVAFADHLDAAGRPTVVTALTFAYLHLPAERAQAVMTRIRQLAVAYFTFTTFAHVAKGDDDSCFCVVFPITRPITPEEHPRVWRAFDGDLGGCSDPRASGAFTLVPTPSCPRIRLGRAFIERRDGFRVDVDALLSGTRTLPDDDGPGPASSAVPRSSSPELVASGAQ